MNRFFLVWMVFTPQCSDLISPPAETTNVWGPSLEENSGQFSSKNNGQDHRLPVFFQFFFSSFLKAIFCHTRHVFTVTSVKYLL